jgi:type VI secretion system secreted protein VgrG
VTLGDITIKAPVGTYHLEAKIVEVQATATIKLTCGASSIEMTPGTITLTSPMIKLNC